jgi:hypothetical protein
MKGGIGDAGRQMQPVAACEQALGSLACVLVLSGYGLGLFLAAQVGPVTLLIVRSVLRGGRAVAVGLAMAGAVASIDLAYAIVGLAGMGRLLDAGSSRLWLGLLSAAILVGIGTRTLWRGIRARSGLESPDEVVAPSGAFLTAVAATAFNPLTMRCGRCRSRRQRLHGRRTPRQPLSVSSSASGWGRSRGTEDSRRESRSSESGSVVGCGGEGSRDRAERQMAAREESAETPPCNGSRRLSAAADGSESGRRVVRTRIRSCPCAAFLARARAHARGCAAFWERWPPREGLAGPGTRDRVGQVLGRARRARTYLRAE